MRVTKFTTKSSNKYTTFSADFIFSYPFGNKKFKFISLINRFILICRNPSQAMTFGLKVPKRIWFTVPTEYATKIKYEDAFFILALPLAIATQEDLVFEGHISKELFKKTAEIETYYHEVFKKKTSIKVSISENQTEDPDHVGQFFTLGVDSFYTLYCHKDKNDPTKRYLLYVDGYDIPFYQKRFLNTIHANIKQVALQANTEALFIQTNLREITDHIIGWGRYHVSALVAVSTFLNFKKIYISGESFDFPDWGLRFGVDKLYSMSNKKIQFIAHNIGRDKKLKELIASPYKDLFLKYVRVCWENVRLKNIPYNCSACQKCIKTKLSLLSFGITKTPTFSAIDIKNIEKLHLVEHVYKEWQELYKKLQKNKNLDKDILPAIKKVLEKPLRV